MDATSVTPRTQEEILKRIADVKEVDVLGFQTGDYIDYLDFEHAKPFLKEGVTEQEWIDARSESPVKDPKTEMVDYMEFAFGKAHGQRGISADRSIQHMIAWSWLSGDDELNAAIQDAYDNEYGGYGLDILRMICGRLGIAPKDHGDC